MREPCYKCKFEHKPITVEPCDHCSDVYIKTGDHPAFQYAKPTTNYDMLITKTPEEIAEILAKYTSLTELGREACKDGWLDWLRREFEAEEGE